MLKKEKKGNWVPPEDGFFKMCAAQPGRARPSAAAWRRFAYAVAGGRRRYHSAYCAVIGLMELRPDPARRMHPEWERYFDLRE